MVKVINSVEELSGKLVAAGCQVVGSAGKTPKFVYVVAGNDTDMDELQEIVESQVSQETESTKVYAMTMFKAAQRKQSQATHRKLTKFEGEISQQYGASTNKIWGQLRNATRKAPVVLVFDSQASVPASRRGRELELGAVSFDD